MCGLIPFRELPSIGFTSFDIYGQRVLADGAVDPAWPCAPA